MVSGVAPFDELGQMWNDHFINVRQIRVGRLDRNSAIDLLVRPVPDFPENAIGPKVAAEVYSRTGGQPYPLQLYKSLLISRFEYGRQEAGRVRGYSAGRRGSLQSRRLLPPPLL